MFDVFQLAYQRLTSSKSPIILLGASVALGIICIHRSKLDFSKLVCRTLVGPGLNLNEFSRPVVALLSLFCGLAAFRRC